MAETVRTLYVNLELTGQDEILRALKNLKVAGDDIVKARKTQANDEKRANAEIAKAVRDRFAHERQFRKEQAEAERRHKQSLKEQVGLLTQMTTGLRGATATYLIFQATLSKGQQILNSLKAGIDSVIAASSEQQKVDAGLAAAMADQGQYTKAAADALKDYNSELQLHLGIGDEVTAGIEQQIVGLTNLSADLLPQATQAVLQISAVTGKDYPAAALQFSKALEGNTQGLAKFGITIEKGDSQLQIINKVLDKTSAGMAILEAQANTYGGVQERLNQQIGEFKEGLGDIITKNPSVISALDSITGSVNLLVSGFDAGGEAATTMGNTVAIAMTGAALAAVKALQWIDTVASRGKQIQRGLQAAIALPTGGLSIPEVREFWGGLAGQIPLPGPGKKRLGDLDVMSLADPGLIKDEYYDAAIAKLENEMQFLMRGGPVGPQQDPYSRINQMHNATDPNAPTGTTKGKADKDLYQEYEFGFRRPLIPGIPSPTPAAKIWELQTTLAPAIARAIVDRTGQFRGRQQYIAGQMGYNSAMAMMALQFPGGYWEDTFQARPAPGSYDWARMIGTGKGRFRDKWSIDTHRPESGWAGWGDMLRGDNMLSILQGYMSGGLGGAGSAAGSIAGAGLTSGLGGFLGLAGGPIGGWLGGAIGRTIGGIFGGGKKQRGETAALPIYTQDVTLADKLDQLLNITKVQLIRGASLGVDALAAQTRVQRRRAGV